MNSIEFAINTRRYIRGSVTKFYNNISTIKTKSDGDNIALKLKLEKFLNELNDLNKVVQRDLSDNKKLTELNDEFTDCDAYENKILSLLSEISITMDGNKVKVVPNVSLLRNPTVPLPKFESLETENI